VTGPNRFRRDFAGDISGAAAYADVISAVSPDSGELVLTMRNPGKQPLTFTVTASGYGAGSKQLTVPAGGEQTVSWPTGQAHGWYDLLVTVASDSSFRRGLIGHVENGAASIAG
jgi:phospholipase C